jgi:protein-S-isoprenylcysteine O-methyltransferase Ste14
MEEIGYVIGFNVATACAFGRVGGIVVAALRSLATRRHFEVVRFGWVEAITFPEPVVLAITTYALLVNRESPSSVSPTEAAAAVAGALVALAGLGMVVWTLLSWRQLFVGHGVLEGQRLVTRGAFGFVRHPVYLGGMLIWSGLSLCFLSPMAAAITCLYVIPAYLLYIRSEEAMMRESFGDEYRRYCDTVSMLVPRLRARRS